jgi:GAF domain-containing protein
MHSESILSEGLSRKELYEALQVQIEYLFEQESDRTAILANTVAIFKTTPLPLLWIGFYIVQGKQLLLGPFQGTPAVFRIDFGKGVCGTAWEENRTLLVPDVDKFPGHIPCSCFSRSEIAVPIRHEGTVVGILDADSDRFDSYDETDAKYFEKVAEIIGKHWK